MTVAAHAGGRSPQPPPPLPTSTSHPRARRDSTVTERRRGSGPSPGLTTDPRTTTTTTIAFNATSSGSQSGRSPATTISAKAPTPSSVSGPVNAAAPSPPSPRDRLERLINTITCVLRCYAALPTRSPAFLDSLHSFREKAIGMYQQVSAGSGTGTGTEPGTETKAQTTAGVGTGVVHDSSGLSPTLEGAVISGEVDATVSSQRPRGAVTDQRMGTHSALDTRHDEAPEALVAPRESCAPLAASPSCGQNEVDALENEWWESEFVAAWFGPRPGCFTGPGRTRLRSGERPGREREGAGASRRLDLRRDTSYVGLYDE